jgi:hypothetical protein
VDFLTNETSSWDLTDVEMQQIWNSNTPPLQPPGIFQALSTRNVGEVIGDF